jgi:CBS domain-containing protein
MRRVNIRAAFVGEPSYDSETSAAEEGDEAVVLKVRGGDVTVVVPQDTPDATVLEAAGVIRGTLHLENERVLSFEIQDGAVGAFFEHEAAALHSRREAGGTVGMFAPPSAPAERVGAAVRASDLMRTTLVTVPPTAAKEEIARLLTFHEISGVLVVEDERLVGVATEADVIAKPGTTAAEIMTRDVITVTEDTPCEDIARLLTEQPIRRVPVVRDGRPVGVVSRADIVRWVAG